jgi:hypothetical protein
MKLISLNNVGSIAEFWEIGMVVSRWIQRMRPSVHLLPYYAPLTKNNYDTNFKKKYIGGKIRSNIIYSGYQFIVTLTLRVIRDLYLSKALGFLSGEPT